MLGFKRAERCARRLALGLVMVTGLPLAAAAQEVEEPSYPRPKDIQKLHPGLDQLRARYKDTGSAVELADPTSSARSAETPFAAAPIAPDAFDPARLLAGHLLRRI